MMIKNRTSFANGMLFARDLMINALADMADQNPLMVSTLASISEALAVDHIELNHDVMLDDEEGNLLVWGGEVINFEEA